CRRRDTSHHQSHPQARAGQRQTATRLQPRLGRLSADAIVLPFFTKLFAAPAPLQTVFLIRSLRRRWRAASATLEAQAPWRVRFLLISTVPGWRSVPAPTRLGPHDT